MGKVKTIVMGDEIAEEEARKKATAKREQKKSEKKKQEESTPDAEVEAQSTVESNEEEKVEEEKPAKKTKKKIETKYRFNPGKKIVAVKSFIDKNKAYSPKEALELVKKSSYSKFDGSVELHINTISKGLRGSVTLPHGTGKEVRVKIADEALIEALLKSGKIDFDVLVATPDLMPKLARVAKILGPKGLMPNPKTGTIGPDPEKLVKELSGGLVQWKTENEAPIVHMTIGKVSFEAKKLEENLLAITKSIGKDKIRSIFTKPTMGPAVKVQV